MIEFVFLDLDDTVLDFKKAEKIAIRKTISEIGIEPTDDICELYSHCNKLQWEKMERGEITREQVVVGRFQMFFDKIGKAENAAAVAKRYETFLSIGHYFMPGALETVQRLYGNFRLFIASNGLASVQASRLDSSGLRPYFENIFISQEIGYNKPDPAFFRACFSRIPGFDISKAIMVGDSLTSDIQGGIQVGMRTCWYCHKNKEMICKPDHIIHSLSELPELLMSLT